MLLMQMPCSVLLTATSVAFMDAKRICLWHSNCTDWLPNRGIHSLNGAWGSCVSQAWVVKLQRMRRKLFIGTLWQQRGGILKRRMHLL
ncbi:unnamed protein product [Durusdinium trenchii]|uniref:Secreted protein n=1 Tax=Durusdinium trenchii TaxID=1381693 RepID=A0ABP0PLD1_9DINO